MHHRRVDHLVVVARVVASVYGGSGKNIRQPRSRIGQDAESGVDRELAYRCLHVALFLFAQAVLAHEDRALLYQVPLAVFLDVKLRIGVGALGVFHQQQLLHRIVMQIGVHDLSPLAVRRAGRENENQNENEKRTELFHDYVLFIVFIIKEASCSPNIAVMCISEPFSAPGRPFSSEKTHRNFFSGNV